MWRVRGWSDSWNEVDGLCEFSVSSLCLRGESIVNVLPYKIAVLCYVYDDGGNVLLLHRRKMPNAGFYSPIGGKLHLDEGESPHDCALREIEEEIGLTLSHDDVHLCGIISECAYEGETHWLMF